MRKYYGKYRGKVEGNKDAYQQGRLEVSVPGVLEGSRNYAMPCVPYAGKGVGFYAIPPIGADVWVEFEAGDPLKPIWSGCFWGRFEAPGAGRPEQKVLQTELGMILLDDTPGSGGITIETKSGLKLEMDSEGIEITNGQGTVKITGISVNVNNGALEVA